MNAGDGVEVQELTQLEWVNDNQSVGGGSDTTTDVMRHVM
jgi:hypothetical protein